MTSLSQEKIILKINDHWVVFIWPILFIALMWGIFLSTYNLVSAIHEISQVIVYGALVISHHFFFFILFREALSNWVITSERIITFQVTPLIKDDVTYIFIPEIREIKKIKEGIFQNMLNYGDVIIHVAESDRPFIMNNVPHPSRFVSIIEDIKAKKEPSL